MNPMQSFLVCVECYATLFSYAHMHTTLRSNVEAQMNGIAEKLSKQQYKIKWKKEMLSTMNLERSTTFFLN